MIWATDFEEEVIDAPAAAAAAARAGAVAAARSDATTIEYRYFANFAVALCEGEISGIGRVWADGQELDLVGSTSTASTPAARRRRPTA